MTSALHTEFGDIAGLRTALAERRVSAVELAESGLKAAQAADRAKSFFLASMSHEIRTPLNAVIGFAELLQDNTLEPALQNEYLAAIASAGNALLALINDVLDLSKLEAGQMEIHPAETDFAELVYEIGNIFRRKQTEKGLESSYDIRPMPLIYVDKLRLRQMRGVQSSHFPLYLKECELRYNSRDQDLLPVLAQALCAFVPRPAETKTAANGLAQVR